MERFIAASKALSDPTRVRLFSALRDGELCVCQLIELTGLAPSTVSRHLAVLQHAGLAQSRKDGRWVYYRLPRRFADPGTGQLARLALKNLAASPDIRRDALRMKKIRNTDLEALCRKLTERN